MPSVTASEGTLILRMQLLIARAAQKDSLHWWEDETLTPAGSFVLDRLFPFSPSQTACKLALAAATARYHAAFAGEAQVLHLYALDTDGQVALALREAPLDNCGASSEPIDSVAKLEQQISALLAEKRTEQEFLKELAGHRLELKGKAQTLSPLDRAKLFTWACLEGKAGVPVFPFLRV
jgi:hypothetical protein